MGGTQVATGSSNQWTSGAFNNQSTQTPIFPPELKSIELSTAQHLANVQSGLPLEGKYGAQIENPDWTNWNKQFGQYGGLVGKYYVLKSDPNQVVYKLLDDSGQREGYYVGGKGGPEVGPDAVQLIDIPQSPVQRINDPNTYQQGTSFLEPSPQQVAPMTNLEQQAAALSPNVANMPLSEILAMGYAGNAQNTPTNAPYFSPGAFTDSDYYKSALEAFNKGVAPTIQNQMALSGLGRSSTLGDSLAQGWASIVPSILSQYATQYVEPQLGREENTLSRQAALVPSLGNLGAQDTSRLVTGINTMMQSGGLDRSIQQAQFDANYQDQLRRQALAEEAVYTPMGMLFPSAIGQNLVSSGTYNSTTQGTTSQSKSGGGLFK